MDKKEANILLLSDEKCEYETLVEAGYMNIFWFQSVLRAYEYFKDREDELKKFDIILMGSRAISGFSFGKYEKIFNSVTYWNDYVEKMRFFTSSKRENSEQLFYISYPNVTSLGVHKEQFLSILNDTIPDEQELKGEKISVPEGEEKEIVLPNAQEKVKVLYMGYARNNEAVEKVLKEAGFTNYDYIGAIGSIDNNVEKLANYDLVVVYDTYNSQVALLGNELHDYMKDKGKSIYFAIYNSTYRGSNTYNYQITGFSTENPDDKKVIRFKSMGQEDDALGDIVQTVINMYATYNKNMENFALPTVEDLNKKYEDKIKAIEEEERRILDNIGMLVDIEKYVREYRRFINKGYNINDLNNIKIDILADGVSVALLVDNRETLRLTFQDKNKKSNLGSKFYLEYLDEKENMLPAVFRNYYQYPNLEANIPDLLSSEELRKIKPLYSELKNVLMPKIDEIIIKERLEEEKRYKEKEIINYIKDMLYKYRRFYRRHMLGYTDGLKNLKIDILQDEVSVAFLVGNREALRMTFKDDDEKLNQDITFYLEYLNNKGNLCSPKKWVCSSIGKSSFYPSDEEMKKVESMSKRIKAELEPIINHLEQIDKNNKNKRYNKKYMI